MNSGIINISKSFDSLKVLDGLSLEFIPHRINCILGPSGCGKTTLLNILAGLIAPETGSTHFFENNKISYIFQEDRLLPWKTVRQNIQFVLESYYQEEILEKMVLKNIELIELGHFSEYYPHQLSGGMKRRVSIARAFSYPSEVILLDEPFKGIDISLKQNLMQSIWSMWSKDNRALIYVTHDIDEAILMGHRIFVFSERPASVSGLFDQPVNDGPSRSMTMDDNSLKEKIRNLLMPVK